MMPSYDGSHVSYAFGVSYQGDIQDPCIVHFNLQLHPFVIVSLCIAHREFRIRDSWIGDCRLLIATTVCMVRTSVRPMPLVRGVLFISLDIHLFSQIVDMTVACQDI